MNFGRRLNDEDIIFWFILITFKSLDICENHVNLNTSSEPLVFNNKWTRLKEQTHFRSEIFHTCCSRSTVNEMNYFTMTKFNVMRFVSKWNSNAFKAFLLIRPFCIKSFCLSRGSSFSLFHRLTYLSPKCSIMQFNYGHEKVASWFN